MKIVSVVGARPNFMKVAPIVEEIKRHKSIKHYLVHTGQHYNRELSDLFFKELKMPKPNKHLGVGSGTHAEQTAKILVGMEKVLLKKRPGLVIVAGDCNSTLGGALAAVKLHIPIAHVEAGLRSFNKMMPEEHNRILTDQMADFLFTTEQSANLNLKREGIPKSKVYFVGNAMIDSLEKHKKRAAKSKILEGLGLKSKEFVLLTMHRPENVDHKKILSGILDALNETQKKIKIVWPVHPRADKMLRKFGLLKKVKNMKNLVMLPSLGYLDFMKLMMDCRFVVTDSGGIQEETTILGVGCVTIRAETERPVTVKQGTNVVAGNSKKGILKCINSALRKKKWKTKKPKFWDGKTSKRIVKILMEELG